MEADPIFVRQQRLYFFKARRAGGLAVLKPVFQKGGQIVLRRPALIAHMQSKGPRPGPVCLSRSVPPPGNELIKVFFRKLEFLKVNECCRCTLNPTALPP